MTLVRLSPAALSRSRFAVSPLTETLGSLMALDRAGPGPQLARWHARHQDAYRKWLRRNEVAAGLVPLVAATKWLPDLVALPPADGMRTTMADELREVERFTDDQVRDTITQSVAASWKPQDTGWLALTGLAARAAAVLEEGWELFVAPDWPRRRAVLERDIMYRAGLLAAYGWKHAVETMTRKPTWVGENAIRFSDQHWPDREVGDEGLVFVPHTAGGGRWLCERGPHCALVYPARGAGASAGDQPGDALSTLLGPGRATVVRELGTPATSSQLARVLGVSLGTVSAHLAVLRRSGVVARAKLGRTVVYRLTERGEELVALLADPLADGEG
ncbi:ArsR/SmtB family transcription factor [Lentzea sp. NPDC060358]|uniref:ArsR/SmtB family transcription factor n=1 Tax=Lentzea sp. NPDC060358 TaxID=3347103 RepID=UPI00364F69CF